MKPFLIKAGFVAALLLGHYAISAAQPGEKGAVMTALNNYMMGSSYNNAERIKSAFYAEAEMFLDHPEKPIYLMKPGKYADLFANREQGVFNGRYGKILSIDIEGGIATAKAEILMPSRDSRYIDIFLLKKLEGEWKIISKAAGRTDSTRSGEKLLLITTDKGKGEVFSDLIADYEQAVAGGYTVDIISPKGGRVAFKNLNMENPKHRDYIYNADFIYALEHSLSASDVQASDYVAAHYVRDKDARKMKSGYAGIDKLYAEICAGEGTCEN